MFRSCPALKRKSERLVPADTGSGVRPSKISGVLTASKEDPVAVFSLQDFVKSKLDDGVGDLERGRNRVSPWTCTG